MKAKFSEYLNEIAPAMKELIAVLKERYDYVSVLSSDSVGFTAAISQYAKSVSNSTITTERGNVVRVYKDGLYSEYAFNRFDASNISGLCEEIIHALDSQLDLLKETGVKVYETPVLPDEPIVVFEEMETGSMPENTSLEKLVEELTAVSNEVVNSSEAIAECIVRGSSTHINKMFLTANRDMRQSYVYTEGMAAPIAMRDGRNELSYTSVSGRKGPEILSGLRDKALEAAKTAEELLDAEAIEPGEYEIITTPEVSGLIAHEAFGHGVEMDMFVKDRALGKEYINKRVGSDLVTMHEGALCTEEVASYAFDDEGTLAGDTIEIQNGILKTGVCDALSALRLGGKPTGNGKRENFEHKVYTRMTNTVFDAGNNTLDEMIASVKSGYLLKGMKSGMEDPKHWGIQCIIERGYEIKDGKLTGKVVAPIVMTGYVPDLLGSITMAGTDKEVFGSGACGKGHKEWVKVSDGGPCLKAKARLG
ncbi:MAG: TldD/PmbA family protein [Solobacterium sp.]|nr:TldD/PmbA family protein [Solobacterium sp.]